MRPFLNDHQKAVLFVCVTATWIINQRIKKSW